MNPIIQVETIVRTFGSTRAIDGISFSVDEGEVFGVLGPNGSGKTTLVRLLNGVLAPTSGKAFLFGRDVTIDGSYIRKRTGVLTETPSLYERFTAKKNLAFFCRFYGIPDAEIPRRVDRVLSLLDLADRGDEAVGGFSKGMKQRLAIARALIHDPQVIFLDEPTSGLDPEAARQVHGIIRGLASDKGKTIFMCTHNLNEAQNLCSRVAMINKGRVLAQGSIRDLSDRLWKAVPIEMEFLNPAPPAVTEKIRTMEGVTIEGQTVNSLTLRVSHRDLVPVVIGTAVKNGAEIFRVTPRNNTLEEIYFAVQEQEGGAA
ncbi:MAG TPA: ABC transporter ATP-binding protein [Methanoregula sp.]|nr:ABC transporter ATP-binding protein [Methanoregula sp.]